MNSSECVWRGGLCEAPHAGEQFKSNSSSDKKTKSPATVARVFVSLKNWHVET